MTADLYFDCGTYVRRVVGELQNASDDNDDVDDNEKEAGVVVRLS